MKARETALKSQAGYLLVPVGDCAGCIRADIGNWQQEAAKHGLSMILLSSASPDHMQRFRRELGLKAPIVFDPGDRLSRRLNAVWMARPFLFSNDWHLRWKPDAYQFAYTPFSDPTFLAALKEVKR